MNGTQLFITLSYTAFVAAALWVAVVVIRSTRGSRPGDVDTKLIERREGLWGIAVVAFLVILLLATIFSTPYFDNTAEGSGNQIVRVDGVQFAWVIRPNKVRAGRPVEFRLHTKDVNHAFALYRGNKLEVQVQVPPDHDQRLVHTFDRPGTLRVVCLEFCGVNHHLMQSQLQVVR